jgi:hypothetical protein
MLGRMRDAFRESSSLTRRENRPRFVRFIENVALAIWRQSRS